MDDRTKLRNQYRTFAVFGVMWAALMFLGRAPTMELERYVLAASAAVSFFFAGYKWLEYREKYPRT